MFVTIDTILKDHGMTIGGGSSYAGFVELKRQTGINGTTLPFPTDHYNPKRDVCLVFVNGVYLLPKSDYVVERGEEFKFFIPLVDAKVELLVIKTVKPEAPLTNGSWIEDGSVLTKKIASGFIAKLTDPEQKAIAQARVDAALSDLDNLTKDFAAIELFWKVQNRVSGGTVFADDFKAAPIQMEIDETHTTLVQAANTGATSLTVQNSIGLLVGHEVTLFDNASFERRIIRAISGNILTIDATSQNYKVGATVCRSTAKRNEVLDRLDLDTWTDPVTNSVFEIGTYDVRYRLPENDRIVTWVTADEATIDVQVAYPSTFDLTIEQANNPSPHVNWQLITPDQVRFEVTGAAGTVTGTQLLINGKVVSSFGSGSGVFSYAIDASLLKAGENTLRVESISADVSRLADLKFKKTPIEQYSPASKTTKGTEVQAVATRSGNEVAVIRYTFTRKNAGVRPTVRRILGGLDRG